MRPLFEQRTLQGPWRVVFEALKGETIEAVYSAFAIQRRFFRRFRSLLEVTSSAGIHQIYLRGEAAAIERLGYELSGSPRVDPCTEFTVEADPAGWKA